MPNPLPQTSDQLKQFLGPQTDQRLDAAQAEVQQRRSTGVPDPKAGLDPLRGILDPLQVDNSIKASAWEAFHGSKTPEEFQQHFDKLQLPNEIKAHLWDLKFKPPIGNIQDLSKVPGVSNVQPQQVQTHMGPMGWYGPTAEAIKRGLGAPGTFFGPREALQDPQQAMQQMAEMAAQNVRAAMQQMQEHPIKAMLQQFFGGSSMPLSEQGAIQGPPAFDVQAAMQPQSQFGQ